MFEIEKDFSYNYIVQFSTFVLMLATYCIHKQLTFGIPDLIHCANMISSSSSESPTFSSKDKRFFITFFLCSTYLD